MIVSRREVNVFKTGDSLALILTTELGKMGLKNGDKVLVTLEDGKIIIEKVKK